ncbi:MAG TPA: ABC transporter permease [Planctomycetota bacterium]|nr:ABC transporter permease [Planctomycetota bacterium]
MKVRREAVVLAVLALLVAGTGLRAPNFLASSNLVPLSRQAAVLAIPAMGQAFVILTGGIDLSIGSVLALVSVLTGLAMAGGRTGASAVPSAVCGLFALGAALAIGLGHGALVGRLRVPPFVVTLATFCAARSLAEVLSHATPITVEGRGGFRALWDETFLGLPVPVWIAAAVLIGAETLLRRSVLGRRFYAVGGNAEAARLAGVPVGGVLAAAYGICALLVAVTALLTTARLGQGDPKTGQLLELNAIAAAVVGGCALAGGAGSAFGAALGAATIAVLQNALILLRVNALWHPFVVGVVLLATVALDRAARRGPVAAVREGVRGPN